jgi:hypothetical protein
MDEEKSVRIIFSPEEIQLYNLAQERCVEKNISLSAYLKDLIKVDLAWGRFARRKKSSEKNPRKGE